MPLQVVSLHTPYFGWLVFAFALALRVAYILEADASPLFAHPAVDAKTYAHHAQRLAAGNWLGVGEGPFWQPPLYPYFLGAVKVLFPESFFYAVRFVQALLGALVCAMSWWVGRTLFNPAVGLLAGVGAALCGPLIFFDGELLPASLAAFVDLLALVVLLYVWRRPSRWGFLGTGVAFGIGALAVPTVLTLCSRRAHRPLVAHSPAAGFGLGRSILPRRGLGYRAGGLAQLGHRR